MISPETLRRFSLFAGLDAAAYKELAMAGREVSISAGSQLFRENTIADAFYVILNGAITLSIDLDEDGTRRDEISIVREGEMVGWSALVEPYFYTLNAVAATDSTLVRLAAGPTRQLMDENPVIGYILMKRLAKAIGVRLTHLRIECVSKVKA
jgi:CRP-like cAMP-binding protein